MTELFESLAIWGVDPRIPEGARAMTLVVAIVVTVVSGFGAIMIKDKRVVTKGENFSTMSGFYALFVCLPFMMVINSLEFLILIQASASKGMFIAVAIMVAIHTFLKAINLDFDKGEISLWGLIAFFQQKAYNLIVMPDHRYLGDRIIKPIIAKRHISLTQKKYLKNVKN